MKHIITPEKPFPNWAVVDAPIYDILTGKTYSLQNAVCVWDEVGVRYYIFFVDNSSSTSELISPSVHDYTNYQTVGGGKLMSFNWLVPPSQNYNTNVTQRMLSCVSLHVINYKRIAVFDEENFVFPPTLEKYKHYSPDFMPIAITINKLWVRQEYYKTYIKGQDNEMQSM